MGYRYNAFGYQTLNVAGRSHFTTISGNGKIETTWAMPTYDPETKLWNVATDFYVDGCYSQGDIAWDGYIPLELLPKDFDPSIAIYRTL